MIDVHGGLPAECDVWDIVTEGGDDTSNFPSLALDKCGFFQYGRFLSQVFFQIPKFIPNLSQIGFGINKGNMIIGFGNCPESG